MPAKPIRKPRVFKTAWLAKAAKKIQIQDTELCNAAREAMEGQVADLGGGVFKKRLAGNRHRSIILAKGKQVWVFEYLFAKQDRENIDDDELAGFRLLAKQYAALTTEQLDAVIATQHFLEICHDD